MKKFMLIFVNLLTMVRIIGVFMMIPVYFNYGGLYAAILSICCYLTDCIDGFLARKFHVATFFGSMFDGVADKLFSCSNLIILFKVTKYSIASIIFELAVVLIQFIKFQKNINVKTSKIGKIKTIVMTATVLFTNCLGVGHTTLFNSALKSFQKCLLFLLSFLVVSVFFTFSFFAILFPP